MMESTLLYVALIGLAAFLILRKRPQKTATLTLVKDDLAKAREAAKVTSDIEQIKKELAEKESQQKDLTPSQVEEFWKKRQ